ncbi:hypothetical protein D3C71_1885420 [compost metagenome]
MAGRVPVLRQDHMLEPPDEIVDRRHDLIASGNGKRSARAEIVLHVDDDQRLSSHRFPLDRTNPHRSPKSI